MSTIPSPVRTVVDLFSTDLADVRFGDVDAKKLASLVSEVEAAADALASAQALLDAYALREPRPIAIAADGACSRA